MTKAEGGDSGWAAGRPFYYGWMVLAASAAIELLITGATSYSASLFVLPLQAEFSLSRADASSPVLILFLGAALCGPIAGRVLDRFPIRPVMYFGVVSSQQARCYSSPAVPRLRRWPWRCCCRRHWAIWCWGC